MPKAKPKVNSRTKVRVVNHWDKVKTQLDKKKSRNALIAVGQYIAQQFYFYVEDIDLIDTSFYQESAYINMQGVTSYPNTWKTGTYFGANHSGRMQKRERAPMIRGTHKKLGVVVGIAAAYAEHLEKKHGALTKALMKSREHFGGSGIIDIGPEDLKIG